MFSMFQGRRCLILVTECARATLLVSHLFGAMQPLAEAAKQGFVGAASE